MEITGPYQLPPEEQPSTIIVAGVSERTVIAPSRTSRVGKVVQVPPEVSLYVGEEYLDSTIEENPHGERVHKESFLDRINNTRRIYLHYTNWCGYCKKMKPVWAQVKEALKDSGLQFIEVDEDIAKTPGVNSYPTILMLDENGYRHQYPGWIEFESLRAWCVSPAQQKVH
jgi:thiol-disulfide isomerase/thioredoxin